MYSSTMGTMKKKHNLRMRNLIPQKNQEESSNQFENPPSSEQPSVPSSTATPNITAGQWNAHSSAKAYIRSSTFSRNGLIEQLEYEQYSYEVAVYGADNCGADWNEQAAKTAAF